MPLQRLIEMNCYVYEHSTLHQLEDKDCGVQKFEYPGLRTSLYSASAFWNSSSLDPTSWSYSPITLSTSCKKSEVPCGFR